MYILALFDLHRAKDDGPYVSEDEGGGEEVSRAPMCAIYIYIYIYIYIHPSLSLPVSDLRDRHGTAQSLSLSLSLPLSTEIDTARPTGAVSESTWSIWELRASDWDWGAIPV
jgi:hypothetical protein